MESNELENNPVFSETNENSINKDTLVDEVAPMQGDVMQDMLQTAEEPLNLDLLVEKLTAIKEELRRSNKLFENKLLYDATKEEVINRLHKELQGYKDDLFKKILKPIIMDMIAFADSMKTLVSRYEESPEPEVIIEKYQKLRKEFMKVGSHIDDVIYNYGIEPFSSNQGDEFNPRTQQARKNTLTENPDENKKIISSLSPGYIWDGQLLRKEGVQVSICEQQIENNNNQ